MILPHDLVACFFVGRCCRTILSHDLVHESGRTRAHVLLFVGDLFVVGDCYTSSLYMCVHVLLLNVSL